MSKKSLTNVATIQQRLEIHRQRIFGIRPADREATSPSPAATERSNPNKNNENNTVTGFPRSATLRLILANPESVVWIGCILARRMGFSSRVNTKSLEKAIARLWGMLYCLANSKKNGSKK